MRFPDLASVERLITLQARESVVLEFKSTLDTSTNGHRKELLKDLTGMGNGGGGTVLYGVAERDGAAGDVTPLTERGQIGVLQDIVRDGVQPPLLYSVAAYDHLDGFVLAVDVEPSPLGPYMVSAYGERRFHRRVGDRVWPMDERFVRDAYALAARATERRPELWREHQLPIRIADDRVRLTVAGIPLEPLSDVLDLRSVHLDEFRKPEAVGSYVNVASLSFAVGRLRFWAGGIEGDDGHNDGLPNIVVRLHRDGSAGMSGAMSPESYPQILARTLNCYLMYLAWFWERFGLSRPVELKVVLEHLGLCRLPDYHQTGSTRAMIEPRGFEQDGLQLDLEVLPWELGRASVRHEILDNFTDRYVQAFGIPSFTEMFEKGMLFGRGGHITQHSLLGGMLWGHVGRKQSAFIDSEGRVRSTSSASSVSAFVSDGVILDLNGDTLAVLEMAPGFGCPDDFKPAALPSDIMSQMKVVEFAEMPSDITIPGATGIWSRKTLQEVLDGASMES